jgi:peptidyl-prolyl cis-trans isomerase D
LAEPAFAAQPDEVVGPVRTNFGWHLLRISEVQAESRTPLDEVRARLGEELRVERATDLVFRRSTRFEDDLLAGATLDESARRFGVTPVTLDAVSRTGRTPDDAVPPALLGADVALREAFTLEAGRRTNLIALADDRFVAIQVLAIDPPAPRPFETVADEVRASWVAAERDKALAALADRVTAALVAGAPIAQVAEDAKASVTISEPFGRDGGGGQLPRQVTTALFANAVGSVSGGRHADGWVVARLTEIRAVDPAQATDQVTAITRQFRAAVEQDLGQQFQEALRKRYPVKVNRQAVDGLL